jgi:hypothetical protein
MADILKFRTRQQLANDRAQGRTLCRSGFHRWVLCPETRFDVHQGRLVTVERCERCGAERVTAR